MVTLLLTLGDKPPNHPNFYIFVAFLTFIVDEHRNLKFGVQVDHNKSQPTDDKLSPERGVVMSDDPF